MQISPDGKLLSFVKSLNGTPNLWVKMTDEPLGKARPITDQSRAIRTHVWTRDSKYVLFTQDVNGDENFAVYAVDPRTAPAPGRIVPASRRLTNVEGVRSIIYTVPTNVPDTVYVGMNDRDRAWHDLYSVEISSTRRTLIRVNDLRVTRWIFDPKEALRLAVRAAENGDTEILRLDEQGHSKIYSCTVFEACGPLQFHTDGDHFYMNSNRGSAVNFTRLILVDARNGNERAVDIDPEHRLDLRRAVFSSGTGDLVATTYTDDNGSRWVWHDPAQKADFAVLQAQLPRRELSFTASSDDNLWLVHAQADVSR